MISLEIKDTKTFMSHLLIKDSFNSMLLSEAELAMANSYTIQGKINRSFYTDEEYESLSNKDYSLWEDIKPFCYSLVKGSRVPASMKIIFKASLQITEDVINSSDTSLTADDVEGLYINIRYRDSRLNLVTGISLNSFSLDKGVEHSFDRYVKTVLDHLNISYEEM